MPRLLSALALLVFLCGCGGGTPEAPATPKLSRGQTYVKQAREAAAEGDYKMAASNAHLALEFLPRDGLPEEATAFLPTTAEYEAKAGNLEGAIALYDKILKDDPKNTQYLEEREKLNKQMELSLDKGRMKQLLSKLEEAESQAKSGGEDRARIILDKIESDLQASGDPKLSARATAVRKKINSARQAGRESRKRDALKLLSRSTEVVWSSTSQREMKNEELLRKKHGEQYIHDARAGVYSREALERELKEIQASYKRSFGRRGYHVAPSVP